MWLSTHTHTQSLILSKGGRGGECTKRQCGCRRMRFVSGSDAPDADRHHNGDMDIFLDYYLLIIYFSKKYFYIKKQREENQITLPKMESSN